MVYTIFKQENVEKWNGIIGEYFPDYKGSFSIFAYDWMGRIFVIEKNEKYNSSKNVDVLIGEDVLGGLFGLKDNYIYYFAPDTNEWENMEVYYTQFLDWLINRSDDVNKFYELYRWNNWKEDCKKLKLTEGYHFYPLLQSNYDMEKRDRKIISIDELIRFNLNI